MLQRCLKVTISTCVADARKDKKPRRDFPLSPLPAVLSFTLSALLIWEIRLENLYVTQQRSPSRISLVQLLTAVKNRMVKMNYLISMELLCTKEVDVAQAITLVSARASTENGTIATMIMSVAPCLTKYYANKLTYSSIKRE